MAIENLDPESVAAPPEDESPRPRRRRDLRLREGRARVLLETLQRTLDERRPWHDQRLARYAKFRGWLNERRWPWDHASNQWVPLLMEKVLRNEAGLFNAILSQRPIIQAKALRKVDQDKVEPTTDLLDYQFFVEDDGERKCDRLTQQLVQDGVILGKTTWVTETRDLVDLRHLPRDPGRPLLVEVEAALARGFFDRAVLDARPLDAEGTRWAVVLASAEPGVDGRPRADPEIRLEVYEADAAHLEVEVTRPVVTFDGPTTTICLLEDVAVPLRSENAQPVSPQNPTGAPWIAHRVQLALDDLRRGRSRGPRGEPPRYRISDEDWARLEARAQPRAHDDGRDQTDQMQREKEARAGLEATGAEPAGPDEPSEGWIVAWEWYGAEALTEDGPREELVSLLVPGLDLDIRTRRLTEVMPGETLERPFAEARFIPVPGQFYGISLLEVLEGLHDWDTATINQAMDAGTLANIPFGFIRPSSQVNPSQPIRVEPGVLLPVDNPAQDVHFPLLQGRDQSFALNLHGLIAGSADRLASAGPLQYGQVPTGKASAVRTVGTTIALAQEASVQPQQALRRLFMGLRDLYRQRHRLNTRKLPPGKAYRIVGRPTDGGDPFGVIEGREALASSLLFDFEASLLNANKGLVAQALREIGMILMSPLMLQAGLVGPEQIYTWGRDYIRANEQDHTRYLTRPPGATEGARLYAEEAMDLVLSGVPVPATAVPFEEPQAHLQALLAYIQRPEVQGMSATAVAYFTDWVTRVQVRAQQALQQQALLAAAAASQPAFQGQGGGVMGQQAVPPIQTETPTAEESANPKSGEA